MDLTITVTPSLNVPPNGPNLPRQDVAVFIQADERHNGSLLKRRA